MYFLIIAVALAAGALLVRQGVTSKKRALLGLGVAVLLATPAFFLLLSLWGELLWFDALGYRDRFWTFVLARIGFAAGGALAGCLAVFLLTLPIPKRPSFARVWPEALGALYGLVWGAANWHVVLKWWNRAQVGVSDPVLGQDVGFYLFSLPFYDAVYWLSLSVSLISLAAAGACCFASLAPGDVRRQLSELGLGTDEAFERRAEPSQHQAPVAGLSAVHLALGVAGLVLAAGCYLNVFHLMFSEYGAVRGAGWTDLHVRRPGYYVTAVVTAALGCWFLFRAIQRFLADQGEQALQLDREGLRIAVPIAGLAGVAAVALVLAPGVAQWLRVSPNEITVERPYIEHNIKFTRQAFGLDTVERREFPVSEKLTRETVDNNRHLLSEVRLWDHRALLATYEQFQEIRLYYEFSDVDVDRYTIDGRYRQVMVSPREIEPSNLPSQSQTFVNRRFKYTHGYGLTMAPVSDFTPQGLPNLLVKDLPPKTASPQLDVDRPQIYYGEHTDEHVVVNSEEAEFDYPSGDQNVYNHYSGTGGVLLDSLWRQFLFGWKFDGTRFFFSGYPTPESRVQFHRQIHERVHTLAPFLVYDRDPYVVLEDGKLYWIVDAYTTSRRYPYSEAWSDLPSLPELRGVNYLRNAVKVVVDAYNGSVDFYVFEPDDPIIRVWQRILPGLFKSKEEMPAALRDHVRYPEGLLTVQGAVYAKYHMTDPSVFYNQEDLWVPATEKYRARVQPVEPYYVMWEPPGSDSAEFIVMQPFTPKNRQVMIGWIAGLCDGENYGRLLAYRFPKDKRVLGPQQVETKIDQDRFLSGQLTLWDQRGSNVIRGNLLAIPIGDTMLYVEPIYLRAEAAAYPELRLVVVMHDDRLSYANTFDEALEGLFEDEAAQPRPPTTPSSEPRPSSELVRQANRAFEAYVRLMGQKKFAEAARELEVLQQTLESLAAAERVK